MVSSIPFRLKTKTITTDTLANYNQISFHRSEIIFAKKPLIIAIADTQIQLNVHHIAILPSQMDRKIYFPDHRPRSASNHAGYLLSISNHYLEAIAENFIALPELNHIFDDPHILHYSYNSWQHLLEIIEQIDQRLSVNISDLERKIIFALTSQLFLELFDMLVHFNSEQLNLDEREQLAYQIKAFVENNFVSDLTLSQVAEQFQVSNSTVNRLFHSYFDKTFYRFLLEKRLQVAHHYLAHGESVTDSWQQAGFNDYSNFYRAFKRYFNYRPHETKNHKN
ncbi:helix-turn-helix transcriptional regulator [Aerococcus kribbianus]|uniref:Helix-turn-helix transcriptional regulator n=1 Tax=Aerococcus kribbianus TaxID=2999064 RepID=A0A9X3FNY9_9LACT|nr:MULTISPECIES: response regulator transcription factor [unclassified Aerococcus]MCZ0717263.1 helix-turn-helix transcriptional regulator [Aerococcus sp. YH-aer221]MCZ0725551.1 helix-turn-helix transcriptional regulator [Aerococcus sp. YH-aer222]